MAKREEYKTALGKRGYLQVESKSTKKGLLEETKKPSSNKESLRASKLRKVLEEFEKTTGSLLEQVQLRLKQVQEANENDNETMFELKQIGYAMEKQTRRFLES